MWTVQVETFAGSAEDAYGNQGDGWGSPVEQDVYGWAPAGTAEVNGWRHVTTADVELYAPASFTCAPRDRVSLEGVPYEVEGAVEDYTHGPYGYAPGVLVNLRRAVAS